MMDKDFDPREFSDVTRLFPLPNVVMFPHVILPLHIFEPRYRQMTEDALSGDSLITIIQISPPAKGRHWTEPVPLEPVGCLGRIIQHDRLADGRFNLLLLGLKRVRLLGELAVPTLYRMAKVEIVEDQEPIVSDEAAREELVELFRKFHEGRVELAPELSELLLKPIPLGLLSDIMAHSLVLPPGLKQRLLSEPVVEHRVETLRSILQQLSPKAERRPPFPPPFSVN